MLCWFLPYNKVSQLQLHIYPLSLEPLCHPTTYPSWPSRSSQSTKLNFLFYTAASHYIFYIWWCVCMYVCVCVYKFMCVCLVAQSCPTLCNPMDCSPPDLSVHGDSPGSNTGVGCLCYSLSSSHSPLPLPVSTVHCLCLCLYSCLANRFIWTIFSRFYIDALIYNICFSPSDLLHSV